MILQLKVVLLLSAVFTNILAQVGDKCKLKHTGAAGVCKVARDCAIVEEQAKAGISPTLCGFIYSTIPIVCCEGATISNVQANENSFLNVDSTNPSDGFVYPDELPDFDKSLSEQKCEEYSKSIVGFVDVLPLVANAQPTSINVTKCDYDGVPLIVGGQPAIAGEFPYMAAIGFNSDGEILWNCGGTLISDSYVMTAAHCSNTASFGAPIKVRLGELDLRRDDDGAEPEDFDIDDIIVHPNYQPSSKRNDIALMKLSQTVIFSKFIRPACLWKKFEIDHETAIATGWGTTEDAGDPSDKLLKVPLNLYSNSQCDRTYGNRYFPHGLPHTMLCAGELKGGKDTCQGDSGGPLIVTKKGNQCIFYALGITSFGKACAAANTPAVYTRVSEFIPWIERIVW